MEEKKYFKSDLVKAQHELVKICLNKNISDEEKIALRRLFKKAYDAFMEEQKDNSPIGEGIYQSFHTHLLETPLGEKSKVAVKDLNQQMFVLKMSFGGKGEVV